MKRAFCLKKSLSDSLAFPFTFFPYCRYSVSALLTQQCLFESFKFFFIFAGGEKGFGRLNRSIKINEKFLLIDFRDEKLPPFCWTCNDQRNHNVKWRLNFQLPSFGLQIMGPKKENTLHPCDWKVKYLTSISTDNGATLLGSQNTQISCSC